MKKIKFNIIIMLLISLKVTSQEIYDLNLNDEYTEKNKKISLTEYFVVKNIPSNDLLSNLESYCDNLRLSTNDKYLDHTYAFYQYQQGIIDTNISMTFQKLYENNNKLVAILKYHQKRDGTEEKQFFLLQNGIPIKCFIDGVEKPKIN